jgi:amino acid adenylation domain-containing protein
MSGETKVGVDRLCCKESKNEKAQSDEAWSEYPRDKCVHHLIEEQALRTPERLAACFGIDHLTYGELERRANRLANYLVRLGVGPEVLVGIAVERSLEMLVALLGILKAGGAYVPLDPAYPKERLSFMLADSTLQFLVTERQLLPGLPPHLGKTICLDVEGEAIASESVAIPAVTVKPHNLAYVLYTSGSTGKPKGVQVEHRSLVNFLLSMRHWPGLTEKDLLAAVTTLSFDIAGLELYLPLIVGACVVIVSHRVACDGEQLLATLARCGATVMQATPVTWRLLIEAGWTGGGLKVFCGGEALSRELARQLMRRSTSVWNLYGPTETTIWSSVFQVTDSIKATVPIGRPIANTQMYILDSQQRPVPAEDIGELCIGGDGLARGYLNRPELTSQKFIPNPFRPGSRLYRTGDLARYLSSGDIEFLGRSDHQVKIRGFRVELGEVEAALEEYPGVQHAIAIAREDKRGINQLVAYIVSETQPRPSPTLVRATLKTKLPSYMIPTSFVHLDAMPLTANGKIDRRALPEPASDGDKEQADLVGPRNREERQIIKLWQNLLGRKPIGINDNFFDLGGDSLSAVRLMVRIEKMCGKRIPIAALFETPTAAQLAALLRKETLPPWRSLVMVQKGGSKPPLFLIHGIGGGVLRYRDLARHLRPEQPVYGLQARGMADNICHERVEDMAKHHIEEIRTVQPEGPYYLGGFSFGGVVAFEIAQQLHQQRQQVGLIALVDTFPTTYKPHGSLTHFWHLPLNQKRIYFARKLRYLMDRTARTITYIFFPTALKKVHNACLIAARQYVPRTYPGRVLLFRATERPLGSKDELFLGWNDLALGGVEIYEVPGNHMSIVDEPAVATLAAQLTSCLEETYKTYTLASVAKSANTRTLVA